MASFFVKYPSWQKLIPDVAAGGAYIASPFVQRGTGGTFSATGKWVSNTFVTSGSLSDGTAPFAYMPGINASGVVAESQSVTVNNAKVGGVNATMAWYDPTKDPALGSSYTTLCSPTTTACQAGNQAFKTPSALHSDGYADWVLVATGP